MMEYPAASEWLVIDLGGSVIAPSNCEGPDAAFTAEILRFLHGWLCRPGESRMRCLGLVIGGGAAARRYQQGIGAASCDQDPVPNEGLDWLGIRATHLNGEYVRLLAVGLKDEAGRSLVTQPLLHRYDRLPPPARLGRIVVGGGWKPGFSTDYDAVLLAEHVGAKRLLCLSNIAQIYDDDPARNPEARPLAELDWNRYQQMVGSEWQPGRSLPFDPVASSHAAQIGLELIFADGRNLANLDLILSGAAFTGTVLRGSSAAVCP